MKRILCLFLAVCTVFTLCACRKKNKNPTDTTGNAIQNNTQGNNYGEPVVENKDMVAVSVPPVTENTLASDGTVLFQYTYQHMSMALSKPEVADKIILDFLNRVDSTRESANATLQMAQDAYTSGSNWVSYLYHITYSPTRIDHSVLSLFGNNVVFSGAPHPERTCVSASYDLKTGDVLTLASIMDKEASVDTFCTLVLNGLKELAESNYLYTGYQDTVKQRFQTDSSIDEAWYFTNTGLCFYFAPYEIAPYSSGVITVEIPYEKLSGVIHADYLPVKRSGANGNVVITPVDNISDIMDINNAELIMNTDGTLFMAQSEGYVQDVRITFTDKTTSCTVFAAYALYNGDGITIQANDATREKLKLTYKSGTETISTNIK